MWIMGNSALWLMLAAAVVAAGGETTPDFSGTWKLNLAKTRLEIDPPAKTIFVIEHRDPKFKLTRTHTLGERPDTWSFESTTDGKEHYQKDGEFESWTRVNWMGEELVLDMKVKYRGEEGADVVHYWLTDGEKTFVAAEVSPAEPSAPQFVGF